MLDDNAIISSAQPRKNERPRHPCITQSVLTLSRTKEYWYRKHKWNKENEYYRWQYKSAGNNLTALLRRSKMANYCSLIAANQRNSRNLWQVINSVIKGNTRSSPLPGLSLFGGWNAWWWWFFFFGARMDEMQNCLPALMSTLPMLAAILHYSYPLWAASHCLLAL